MHSFSAISRFEYVFLVLFFVCLFAAGSDAAMLVVKNLSKTLLDMDNLTDYTVKTCLLFLAYLFQYLATGGIFEYTNPAPKTEKRMASMMEEIKLGILVTFINIFFATTWLYFVDPFTPYYGYFENNTYTFQHFVTGLFVYMFFADTWFYWTHRMLHVKWFWRHVHYVHHSFVAPTAFCQDAVHWFEAIIQGPCGHFFASLLYPMHPIFLAVAGFLTAVYAIAAHDGRAFDLNNHMKHHSHKMGSTKYEISGVNFGLYWGVWDYICGTRYNPDKCVRWNPTQDVDLISSKNINTMSDSNGSS